MVFSWPSQDVESCWWRIQAILEIYTRDVEALHTRFGSTNITGSGLTCEVNVGRLCISLTMYPHRPQMSEWEQGTSFAQHAARTERKQVGQLLTGTQSHPARRLIAMFNDTLKSEGADKGVFRPAVRAHACKHARSRATVRALARKHTSDRTFLCAQARSSTGTRPMSPCTAAADNMHLTPIQKPFRSAIKGGRSSVLTIIGSPTPSINCSNRSPRLMVDAISPILRNGFLAPRRVGEAWSFQRCSVDEDDALKRISVASFGRKVRLAAPILPLHAFEVSLKRDVTVLQSDSRGNVVFCS